MNPRHWLWLALAPLPALAAGEDPAELIAQLEARMLAAQRVVIEAQIESSGAVASRLRGRSEILERNRARLTYAGEFAGRATELGLRSDGRALELRSGGQHSELPAPAQSNRALLVGFLRMGLLHNLARLTELKAPDHAEGGVDQWVTLDSFRPTTFAQSGELEGLMAFSFDLVVDGEDSATVRIWLDPVSNLPRRRELIVRFARGEMRVVETYTRFEVS